MDNRELGCRGRRPAEDRGLTLGLGIEYAAAQHAPHQRRARETRDGGLLTMLAACAHSDLVDFFCTSPTCWVLLMCPAPW